MSPKNRCNYIKVLHSKELVVYLRSYKRYLDKLQSANKILGVLLKVNWYKICKLSVYKTTSLITTLAKIKLGNRCTQNQHLTTFAGHEYVWIALRISVCNIAMLAMPTWRMMHKHVYCANISIKQASNWTNTSVFWLKSLIC